MGSSVNCVFNKQPKAVSFSKTIIEKCKKCEQLKNKESWCGYWGFWLKDNKIIYPKTVQFPTLKKQAKNFAKAIVKRAKNMKNRSPKEILKVKSICIVCDAYYTKGITPRCTYCGCCINLKTKWESESCPIEKW